jgi:hypothetical protein
MLYRQLAVVVGRDGLQLSYDGLAIDDNDITCLSLVVQCEVEDNENFEKLTLSSSFLRETIQQNYFQWINSSYGKKLCDLLGQN